MLLNQVTKSASPVYRDYFNVFTTVMCGEVIGWGGTGLDQSQIHTHMNQIEVA